MSESITLAELLAELEAVRTDTGPAGAMTLNELIVRFRVGRDRMLDAVRALKTQGRLTVCYVPRESVIGTTVRVPAYVIAPLRDAPRSAKSTRKRGR